MTRISHISVSNFRSIKRLEIDLPQLRTLVGPNNAGKSKILLAIRRVLEREWVTVSDFSEDHRRWAPPATPPFSARDSTTSRAT